jgi:GTP-binding protein
MTFGTNTSPLSGRDGKFVTARKIEDRLFRETQSDVSLRVERIGNSEEWNVCGRGELHLSILIENLRREGFEFQVSRPRVILKEIDGVICEPYEFLQIDVPDEYLGPAIEQIGARRGELVNMESGEGQTRITYHIPSRGLIGFSTEFLTATHGYGICNHTYLEYRPVYQDADFNRKLGALVSMNNGVCTSYACGQMEDRGELLIEPGTEVYEGMIVGICNREEDLAVNITREKQMTNQRSATKDSTVVLKRPRLFSLENYLEFIDDDELVEITPNFIRLRKAILDTVERKKFDSIKLKAKKEKKQN